MQPDPPLINEVSLACVNDIYNLTNVGTQTFFIILATVSSPILKDQQVFIHRDSGLVSEKCVICYMYQRTG